MSDELKQKISEVQKGNKHWLGRHHSEETKKKLSEIHKGKKMPKTSVETINKIANSSETFSFQHIQPNISYLYRVKTLLSTQQFVT